MPFMNEWDIEREGSRRQDHPILGPAIRTLSNLMEWTNGNSDGWGTWAIPSVAAESLVQMIQRDGTSRYFGDMVREDATIEEYRTALRPIKKFRKKFNADFEIVEVGEPEEEPEEPPLADTSAVEVRYERGRYYPTVNIKVHTWRGDLEGLLPLEMGSVKEVGATEFVTVHSDDGFTMDWIDKHLSEEDQSGWWDIACQSGFEDAKDRAHETFGSDVRVYAEGRSGGWLVVHGLQQPVEEWPAELVDRWVPYAKDVRAMADDTPRRYLELLYLNVYESWREAQDKVEETYVLTISTTNPDLKDRVVRAFEVAGLDRSNGGALHHLSASLMHDSEQVWGTEYEPDEDGE